MQPLTTPFSDSMYRAGLLILLVSLFVFCIPLVSDSWNTVNALFSVFFINFIFSCIYCILLMVSGWKNLYNNTLLLILFLISALSLNREFKVFESPTPWFAEFLVVLCINFLSFSIYNTFPQWLKHLHCFLLGMSFIVFLYLSIYLLPLSVFSIAAFFIMGIPLFAFIPILFCLLTLAVMGRAAQISQKPWNSFLLGAFATCALIALFVVTWSHYINKVNAVFKEVSRFKKHNSPEWITTVKKIPVNAITEQILKSGITYSVPDTDAGLFWGGPSRNYEKRRFDPLIMISVFFCGKTDIPENDRIEMFACLHESGHDIPTPGK